jgi:putative ABC transport system substrate-binding protein
MRRRNFIALVGAAAATWPFAARAQSKIRLRRIAIVAGNLGDPETDVRISAFRRRLSELGWSEGRDVRFDLRDTRHFDSAVTELLALAPDLVVVSGNPALAAAQKGTRTIPIVFVLVGDPVGSGLVASLARPGGNATGFSHYEPAMGGKWLEVLKEIAPGVRRALVLLHTDVAANVEFLRSAEAAGPAHAVAVSGAGVRSARDIEQALPDFARQPDGGLIVLPNPVNGGLRALIAQHALRHRLPAVAAFPYMATSGLLSSYGINAVDIYRRAADYVDRIFRGAKPADLPVQLPTKFELVINLKTAGAIGVTVPPTLLARADEVIE